MITSANTTASTSITAENYAFLQQYIYRESGIVLEENKQYLLDARLTPILKNAQLGTINDLCALLKATSPEPLKRAVVEAITTHETLFFRDAAAFEALKSTILPQLKTLREANRRLRIWSAAASSGQEAYSIAMMLLEMGLQSWSIDILGTDLSHQILDRARAGRFANGGAHLLQDRLAVAGLRGDVLSDGGVGLHGHRSPESLPHFAPPDCPRTY